MSKMFCQGFFVLAVAFFVYTAYAPSDKKGENNIRKYD